MSAGITARSTLAAVGGDRVRALQHALYRAAKADPNRRFHALQDKVYREDVLWRAWVAVRTSNGAPGIDKTTLAQVEQYGVARLLGELADELRQKSWRPLPARRVLIPKPGSSECRPLAIAAVRDRIVGLGGVDHAARALILTRLWHLLCEARPARRGDSGSGRSRYQHDTPITWLLRKAMGRPSPNALANSRTGSPVAANQAQLLLPIPAELRLGWWVRAR